MALLYFKRQLHTFKRWREDANGKEIEALTGDAGYADCELHRALDRFGVSNTHRLELLNTGCITSDLTGVDSILASLRQLSASASSSR
jgi:hypothetical protein